MKNILVPTDFSIAAWNAKQYALQLFAESECVFHFLNIKIGSDFESDC